MAFVIIFILFVVAFIVRCYEVLHEETIDNLSLVPEQKDEHDYDAFFAEELEYL